MTGELEQGYNPENEAGRSTLEQQFENSETIEMSGERIKVVDIAPDKRKTEVPTLYVPGFSATPEALKDAILRTAEAGRRVISAEAPHGINIQENDPALAGSNLASAQARKLKVVLELVLAKGLDQVNIIATSEGALVAVAAASLCPEKFRNIVLIEPAGLIGRDTFFQLIKRTVADMANEQKAGKSMQKVQYPAPASVGIKSVLSDISASVREIKGMVQSDITGVLEKLQQQGVKVSIIHGVDDNIFPMEKVQQMTKAGMVDGFYSVSGTHNMVYSYEPYGRVAEEALSALENKGK